MNENQPSTRGGREVVVLVQFNTDPVLINLLGPVRLGLTNAEPANASALLVFLQNLGSWTPPLFPVRNGAPTHGHHDLFERSCFRGRTVRSARRELVE